MKARGFGSTDVGREHENNEDAFLLDDDLGIYAVSDGMGGHAAGEEAARLAIERYSDRFVHPMRFIQGALFLFAVLVSPATAQDRAASLPDYAAQQLGIEVEAALSAIGEDETLSAELRARLADKYKQAQLQVELEKTWRDRGLGFRADSENAPLLASQAQAELDRPASDPRLALRYDTPLAEVERGLHTAQAELDRARTASDSLEQAADTRNQRSLDLARTRGEKRQEATTVSTELDSLLSLAGPTPEQRAQILLLQAKRLALEAEFESHESELAAYQPGSELLAVQKNLAHQRVSAAEAAVAAWSSAVEERRQRETTKAAREVAVAALLVDQISLALRAEAEGYRSLAQQRADLALSIEETAARYKVAESELVRIRNAFDDAKRRVDVAGLTDAVGILLRKHKTDLPRVRDLKRRAVERKDNFATLQLARIDLEDLEERLKTEADIVATALENVAEADKARAKDEARDLFRSHRRVAALVIQDVDRQFRQLLDLEQTELQLLSTSSEFGGYINERILWVRSGKPLWSADLVDSKKGIAWLLNPPNWQAAGSTLWRDARRSPIWYLLAAALLGGLVSMRRLLRRRLLSAGEEAAIRSCRSLGPTIKALGFTLLLLAPGPLIVWLLGWRLSVPLDAPAFSKALGFGLRSSTLPILLVEIVRKTCRSGGLGQKHFEWPSDQLQRIRRRLLLLTGTAVPLYFVVSVFEAHDEAGWKQSLGGIALVVSLVALALLLHNVLFKTSGQQTRAQAIARASVCVLPLVLALLAVSGFIFTSLELTRRLLMSFGLGVAATLVYAVVRRWLLVTRSRIRRDQALARRKKSKEQDADEPEIPVEEEKVDLEMATLQSRLLLRNVLVFATLLGAWLVWVDVLPALRVFDQVKLWPTTFTQIENVVGDEGVTEAVTSTTLRYITLGNAFFALLVLAATYYGTKNIPSILEVSILQRLSLGAGERYAVATLTRYAITLTGVVTALGVIGIGWAKVQWLAAAVTVGLGFGLQEIFGNFVSGLIILFERPIRVGDYVTVGDTDGRVTKIRMRATTITDWDLREMIVPNKEFITSRIVNWTLSNPITRIVFPVGVAYGSDTDLARKLLLEIAQQDPLVLNDPGPSAVFVKFGDSVLEIHLRVFLENRDNWPELVTRINTRIHEGFAEAAIEIAFPQRDLHLRSIGPLADVLSKHPGLVVEEVGAEPREVT